MLDSQTVSGFTAGQYLVWNIAGNVTFHVTSTGGANAVVSGIFFGPGAHATFNSSDSTTQGNWIGVYGGDGYNVILDSASYPAYVNAVTANGKSDLTWSSAPTDIRALVRASNHSTRIAACWTASDEFDIVVPFNDSNSHQLALYFVDWDNSGRWALIDVKDTASGITLDSRAISAFSNGIYLSWNITGSVTIHVVSAGGSSVLSGMFFGPPPQ